MRLLIASTILVLAAWPTVAGPNYPFPEELAALPDGGGVASSVSPTLPPSASAASPSGDASTAAEADASPGDGSPQAARNLSRDELCDALASAAQANDLPVGFFVRLIWQESRFVASAVSPAGAQGVAQFMPAVAAEVGLNDPFDPLQALPKSAEFLNALRREFGNLGLAAAAYNAGSGRIKSWLERRAKLPGQMRARARLPKETQHYVTVITGYAPEHWIAGTPENVDFGALARVPCRDEIEADEPPPETRVQVAEAGGAIRISRQRVRVETVPAPAPAPARAALLKPPVVQVADAGGAVAIPKQHVGKRPAPARAALLKARTVHVAHVVDAGSVAPKQHAGKGPASARVTLLQPRATKPNTPRSESVATGSWGVHLAGNFSEAKARETFERLRKKHPVILKDRGPQVVRSRLAGKGATINRIQIALDTRAGAEQLCSTLRSAGGACVVLRN
jgi:Transglycosylase SLT domain